jgi:hypothetical protein
MIWTTALDFFATFFSGAMSLLPIVADQVLGVGPVGYGWLVSAPALGAVLGSIYTRCAARRRQGVVLVAVAFWESHYGHGLPTYWLIFLPGPDRPLRPRIHRIRLTSGSFTPTPSAPHDSVNMIFRASAGRWKRPPRVLSPSAAVGVTVSTARGIALGLRRGHRRRHAGRPSH